MNVLIISGFGLPIPAVKSGAVATLIDSLIHQNESLKELDLTVISTYDYEAYIESKKLQHTKVVYFKKILLIKFFDAILNFCFSILNRKKVEKNIFWKLLVLKKMITYLRIKSFDKVVVENSCFLTRLINNRFIYKKYKNKFYYHLHNDVPKNVDLKALSRCHIISISKYLEKNVISLLGCKEDTNFDVLHNGIAVENYFAPINYSESEQIKEKLKIQATQRVILFVGRVVPYKGVLQVVKAFKMLDRKDVKLVVVGSNDFGKNEETTFIKQLHNEISYIKDSVVFTGYIPNKDIAKYYKIADVAVLPSLWNEPAGLTMVESVASGVPLITTRVGGIPEYIDSQWSILLNNDESLVENLAKSIDEVLANYNLYKNKAMCGQKDVCQRFNEHVFYKNFVRIMKGN